MHPIRPEDISPPPTEPIDITAYLQQIDTHPSHAAKGLLQV